MVEFDPEPSVPEGAPLRFGEILAASTMMPDLPMECWPGYRYSDRRRNDATHALPRFVKITAAALLAAVKRRA
jgi:hypothetical protein